MWRRTARKKLQAGLANSKEWLKANRSTPLPLLMRTLPRKVRGHYNYFRAIGNVASLWSFHSGVVKLLYKWLNRRSQRRSLTWEKLRGLLKRLRFPTPTQAMQGIR